MVGTRITILCHQRLCKALHHKRVDAFSKLEIFFHANCWCCTRPTYSSPVFGETHCTVVPTSVHLLKIHMGVSFPEFFRLIFLVVYLSRFFFF